MNSLKRNSGYMAAIVLAACLPQSALALSQYTGSVDFSYSITANNRNANGNLQFLSITDFLVVIPAVESSSSSYSSSYQEFSGLGELYSVSLAGQDSIAFGNSISEYFSDLKIGFSNNSHDLDDIYDIRIEFNYTLTAQTTGRFADTDVFFSYSNENFNLDELVVAHASSETNSFDQIVNSDSFSFVLAAGELENIYFQSAVVGQLEASVVPIPAAIWLFVSGMVGLIGLRSKQSIRS
ncbi:MAG: hypothetical protein KGZ88_19445 [Methylomicrobium sp.]|nr:hypothetical protein [Methylomicrobium sp.]